MEKKSSLRILTILLVSSLTIMVGSVVAPALPEIVKNLGFNFKPGLLVTLPSLGVVLFSPFVGRLINRIGPFQLICWGLIPYAVLGFVGRYLYNDYLLIADRILLGASCVAIQVSVTTFIAELFEGKERMKVIAWQGMAIELGGVIFLSLGGVLGEESWEYPFLIYLMAIPYLFLTMKTLPKKFKQKADDAHSTQRVSNAGSGWKLPVFIGSFFSMAIFFVAYVSLPMYLPEKFSFSESHTGYFMSAISLVAVVVAGFMPKVVECLTDTRTVCLGFVFFGVGYLLFAYSASLYFMFAGILFTGLGFGLTVPLLNHMVVENSTVKTRGKNLGMYSMMVFAGQFAATAIEFVPVSLSHNFFYAALASALVSVCLFFFFKKS